MDIKDNNTNIWLKIIKIVMCFEIVFWKKEEKISVFNQGPYFSDSSDYHTKLNDYTVYYFEFMFV